MTMDAQDALAHDRDAMTVKQVFVDPYEKDGATLVPVARVRGGAGGGGGEGPPGEGKGAGGGGGEGRRVKGRAPVAASGWTPPPSECTCFAAAS